MMDSYFWRMSPLKRLIFLKRFAGGGGGGSVLKTVTGTLLHILDALAKPAVEFEVGIEPQQSGSGDPSPDNVRPITGWTGVDVTRTGKNICPPDIEQGGFGANGANDNIGEFSHSVRIRTAGYIPVTEGANIVVTAVGTAAYYSISGYPTNDYSGNRTQSSSWIALGSPCAIDAGVKYIRIVFRKENTNHDISPSDISNVMCEYGTTASAYEPFGTTIPITFPALGKNLLDMSDANIEVGKYIDNSGAEKTNSSNFYNTVYIPVKASTAYTLSTSSSIKYCSFMEYDESKTFIKRTLYGNGSAAISTQSHTMGSTTAFVIIGSNPTGNTIDLSGIKAINWMFNEGSTAQAYEPYTTTVYGGTLTNNGTGEWTLSVDRAKITLNGNQLIGLSNWRAFSGTSAWLYQRSSTPNIINPKTGNDPVNLLCDTLPVLNYTPVYQGSVGATIASNTDTWGLAIRVGVEGLTTNALINAWLSENPLTLVYGIDTPITYTLTEQQALVLLKGENNIWADGNGTLSLTYKAQA